jgi:hypothetical protein
VVGEVKRPGMCGLGRVFRQSRPSVSARPDIFQHHVGHRSTHSFPSATSWLALRDKTTKSGFPVGTPMLGRTRPHNNGLHQTGREGAAGSLRRRPVVEARPAGEPECSTDVTCGRGRRTT